MSSSHKMSVIELEIPAGASYEPCRCSCELRTSSCKPVKARLLVPRHVMLVIENLVERPDRTDM